MTQVMPIPAEVAARIRFPLVVVLGSPRPTAELVARLGEGEVVCYQMDLHQAARLREELDATDAKAEVVTLPDLWDLPARFAAVVFPASAHGERELKLDMLEQGFHVLGPRGLMLTLSEYRRDQQFPKWHKKIFGR